MNKRLAIGIFAVLLVLATLTVAQPQATLETSNQKCNWENATMTYMFEGYFVPEYYRSDAYNNCVEYGFTYPKESYINVNPISMKIWGTKYTNNFGQVSGYINDEIVFNESAISSNSAVFYNTTEEAKNTLKPGINNIKICAFGSNFARATVRAIHIDYQIKPANC